MKLYTGGYLTFYMPQKQSCLELRLNAPAPLKDILAGLNLPLAEVHLVSINGELVELETAFAQDNDLVRVFSAVSGG